MKTKSLGFIGGGRITRIFLQAFANKKIEFQSIVVFDTNPDVLDALKKQFPNIVVAETAEQAAQQSTIFIALHPPMIIESLIQIAETISNDALLISLAPKITIEKIASKLKTPNIARLIPNATSYINEGFNPITFGSNFDPKDKSEALMLLQLLGKTFEVAEPKLEAYALLSAMLPTYFWFQWEELTNLGEPMGLTAKETSEAIKQTMLASINLYFESGLSSKQVIDLIPVKPIGEHQQQITEIYQSKLLGLFEKIKP